jgi:hypothetical protein
MPTPHDPLRLLHPEEVRNLLEPGTPEKRWEREQGRESEREQESEQELEPELESLPDR